MKWEKANVGDLPPFWAPRAKGDSLEGPITRISRSQFNEPGENRMMYTLRDERKGLITLKSHRNIEMQMEALEPAPKKGDILKITYVGTRESPNGLQMMYEIEIGRPVINEKEVPF